MTGRPITNISRRAEDMVEEELEFERRSREDRMHEDFVESKKGELK